MPDGVDIVAHMSCFNYKSQSNRYWVFTLPLYVCFRKITSPECIDINRISGTYLTTPSISWRVSPSMDYTVSKSCK